MPIKNLVYLEFICAKTKYFCQNEILNCTMRQFCHFRDQMINANLLIRQQGVVKMKDVVILVLRNITIPYKQIYKQNIIYIYIFNLIFRPFIAIVLVNYYHPIIIQSYNSKYIQELNYITYYMYIKNDRTQSAFLNNFITSQACHINNNIVSSRSTLIIL